MNFCAPSYRSYLWRPSWINPPSADLPIVYFGAAQGAAALGQRLPMLQTLFQR